MLGLPHASTESTAHTWAWLPEVTKNGLESKRG